MLQVVKVALLLAGWCSTLTLSSPALSPREQVSVSHDLNKTVVDSKWDGECFYPKPDRGFTLKDYLGRWYQVAGTRAPFTAGCSCIYADYALNDNGTVKVHNGCQIGTQSITIEGTASAADPIYGDSGVFRVQFPRQPPPACPGPNYIVQQFKNRWAIVQTSNFSTLFLLSRNQNPSEELIDFWLNRAQSLGSNLGNVIKTNQTGCLFT